MQMMGKAPTENSKGVRLVNLPQVRDIQNEEIEALLAGKQTAQQALDNAVRAATRRSRKRRRLTSKGSSLPLSCRQEIPGSSRGMPERKENLRYRHAKT